MKNTLIDNSTEALKMDSVLKKCIADEKFTEILIATGYWDLPGMVVVYDELKAFLDRENTVLRLIIGKEPMIRHYQQAEPLERDDFPGQYLKTDINKLALQDKYQKVVDLLLQYCNAENENSKFQIRIYGQGTIEQFLHAKCYIFKGIDDACGLIGSSNFTFKGLDDNAELNYLETDPTRVTATQIAVANQKSHLMWFNEKWEQSVAWNQVFLEEVLKPSPIGKKAIEKKEAELTKKLTPYEVYIKFLQCQWGDFIDEEWTNALESILPPTIKRLKYQLFAVNQAYSIMHHHHGVMIADVVGLGKTMVGIMLLKRFLTDADPEGRNRNILLVTPPAIKKSWVETIALFDKDQDDKIGNHIEFITTGSIGKLTETIVEEDEEDIENESGEFEGSFDNSKNYGLILIDESHKFRNSNTQMYQQLDELIGNTYPQPYVVLLSATPQNNSPEDLKNQIYLFQREHNNTTLEKIDGRKLETFFADKNRIFKEHIKNRQSNNHALIEMSRDIRERVLDSLVVRRTRTDIRKFYGDDMQELKFPEINGPNVLRYEMDEQLSQLFFKTMNLIASYDTETGKLNFDDKHGLGFYRYRAIEYIVNSEYKKRYEKRNLTAEATSKRLARIMQILLVKRLESSFSAFKSSLHNLQRYTQNMIDMIENNCVFICPDIDVNKELNTELKNKTFDECCDDIRFKIKRKGGNNFEYITKDLDDEYLKKLKADKKLIDKLCMEWDGTTYDPKLIKFLDELDKTLFGEINNPHGYDPKKLVIFTEAIDTVKELKRHIEGRTKYRVMAITAENRDAMSDKIKANFDANADIKQDDYDIIITTEVLSEGVNLHRSNVIVNYDTPWNSTRLMQRIGRVNRIGSKEDFVHVFNFFPTAQSDAQIDLVHKAHTKLQAFHSLFGEDNRVYSDNEEVESYGQDPLTLQHLVEGEESPLEKYIAELKQFKLNYPEEYERISQLNEHLFVGNAFPTDESLFLIRGLSNNGLCVSVNKNGIPKDIPVIEMAEKIQCTPDTVSTTLPENWDVIQQKALDEFNNFFNKMRTGREQKRITKEALEIVQKKLLRHYDFKPEVKELLVKADKLIRKGDLHLSRKIIRFYELTVNPQLTLFDTNLEELEALLEKEMEAVRQRVIIDLNGQPTITLGVGMNVLPQTS
ncbi:MAG: helicase-related protein [Paludibacter sp.]|nr:helicase-related protein [Paludibacter sp.]